MTTPIPNDLPLNDPSSAGKRPPREPLAFAEWWDDLLWPRVLAGAGLALRPNRLGMAFFLVVLTSVLLGVGAWMDATLMKGIAAQALEAHAGAAWLMNPWGWVLSAIHSLAVNGPAQPALADLPWQVLVAKPAYLARNWPVSTLLIGPLLVFAWTVGVGAIARMTAVEVARGTRITWVEGLAFSLRRWRSMVAAVIAPLMVIWGVALVAAIFGYLLLNWQVVNVIGAVLYIVVLGLSLLACLTAGGYVMGGALLVPAVVCEGTDSIDALQRSFAYVTARLPRLLLYLALAAIGVAFVTTVAGLLAGWTVQFAAQACGAWTGDAAQKMLLEPLAWGFGTDRADAAEGSYRAAGGIITFWNSIPTTVIAATLVAGAASASAMLYLAMRQICDGQDVGELWTEGVVEGAMAETMESRGELTKRAIGDAAPPEALED
jgi:hypothetical protein